MVETRRWRLTGLGVVAFGLLAGVSVPSMGCSSSNDKATDGGNGGAQGDDSAAATGDDGGACVTHGLSVDTFAAGMTKVGSAGLFTFELVSADPSPPADPVANTWTIKVTDKTGAPVTDATVSLPVSSPTLGWVQTKNPWMPTMGHGSSISNAPIVNHGDGTATIGMTFTMSGLWQTFVVAQSGSMTDSAMFSFCLP